MSRDGPGSIAPQSVPTPDRFAGALLSSPYDCRMSYAMAAAKDQKLTVMMSEDDMGKLRELAEAEDVAVSHVVRSLIRGAHAERIAAAKKKTRR
jgi:hypothetical protein